MSIFRKTCLILEKFSKRGVDVLEYQEELDKLIGQEKVEGREIERIEIVKKTVEDDRKEAEVLEKGVGDIEKDYFEKEVKWNSVMVENRFGGVEEYEDTIEDEGRD